MRTLTFLLFAIPALAAPVADPCPPPPPPAAESRERARAIVEQAMLGGDARALIAASAWWRVVETAASKRADREANAMLARAAERAGPDRVAWAMLSRACGRDCAIEPAPFDRWLALDADNAAAWAEAVERALAAGDATGARDAIARAALAPRFDGYWAATVAAAVAASRAVPAFPELERFAESQGFAARDAADLEGLGIAFAQGIVGITRLREACTDNPDWREECLHLGRTMEGEGDSYLAQAMGRALQRALLAEGSAEAQALADRQRTYDWQVHQGALLTAVPVELPRALRRLLAMGSEPRALQHQLREAGVPLAPPAGWTAADASAEWAKRFPAPDADALERCEPPRPSSKP